MSCVRVHRSGVRISRKYCPNVAFLYRVTGPYFEYFANICLDYQRVLLAGPCVSFNNSPESSCLREKTRPRLYFVPLFSFGMVV